MLSRGFSGKPGSDRVNTILLALKVCAALAVVVGYFALRRRLLSPSAIAAVAKDPAARAGTARRVQYFAQVAVGLFLLGFGYFIGREHLHLILDGVRTQGTIVAYHEESMTNGGEARWNTMSLPIVAFWNGRESVRFQDWKDPGAAVLNVRVPVLFDPNHPATAMIDRPVWNWIPWAPMMAVGALLLASGLRAISK